jgi:phosphoribosyl 1,2-cyclic phosphodiesterase
MSLSVTLLGSGSTGNSTLVSSGDVHILVDVGLSGKETRRRLQECGVAAEQISAIVVSHEHGDHCRGVAPFSKGLEIPVFMSEPAFAASGMTVDPKRLVPIQSGQPFDVFGVHFTPFSVPHDAADPVGLLIEKAGVKAAIALDLGYVSNLVAERLRGCDLIILESNHDLNMLKVGPYPWSLKQRVMSRRGHLSNDNVAEFIAESFDGSARHLLLAHLSQKNNIPELALLSAKRALEGRDSIGSCQTRIEVAHPDRVGKPICL